MVRGKQLLRLSVAALPLLTGGCAAIPPIVGAVAYAVDGFSFLVSGKTATDHAVSVLAQQDCRLWRLLILQPVCQDSVNDSEARADLTGATESTDDSAAKAPAVTALRAPREAAADGRSGTSPAPAVRAPAVVPPRTRPGAGLWPPVALQAEPAPTRDSQPPAPEVRPSPQRIAVAHSAATTVGAESYLVLGMFRRRSNAEALAHRLLDLGVIITDPAPGSGQFHRVVLGPVGGAGVQTLRQQAANQGVAGVWQATLCLDANSVERSCDGITVEQLPAAAAQAAAVAPQSSVPLGLAPRARPAEVMQSVARMPTLPLSMQPIY